MQTPEKEFYEESFVGIALYFRSRKFTKSQISKLLNNILSDKKVKCTLKRDGGYFLFSKNGIKFQVSLDSLSRSNKVIKPPRVKVGKIKIIISQKDFDKNPSKSGELILDISKSIWNHIYPLGIYGLGKTSVGGDILDANIINIKSDPAFVRWVNFYKKSDLTEEHINKIKSLPIYKFEKIKGGYLLILSPYPHACPPNLNQMVENSLFNTEFLWERSYNRAMLRLKFKKFLRRLKLLS